MVKTICAYNLRFLGYVSVWLAAVIGFVTAVACSCLQDLNDWIGIDEGLYVFKLHGVGGMIGSFMTGIFADQAISALDGVSLSPGGINGNAIQVGKQFAEITAISSYSFIVSCLLLLVLKYTPGMHLRVSEEAEMRGLDLDQFFDEQIGDWAAFEPMEKITHGVELDRRSNERSSESSVEQTVVRTESKVDRMHEA